MKNILSISIQLNFESNTVLLEPKNNFADYYILLFSASVRRFQSKKQKLKFLHWDIESCS